jgi:ssDNA-binding Zn-finger/Zn-ribbon topoisomerase 1
LKKIDEKQKVGNLKRLDKMRCPDCNGKLVLIYTSKDGKAKFYRCKKEHQRNEQIQYPVYMYDALEV